MDRKAPALSLFVLAVFLQPALADPPAPSPKSDAAGLEFFESRVRPLLVENCQSCHGSEKQKGGLRLDSLQALLKGGDNGPAVVPGDVANSLIVQAVGYEGDVQMPPKGKLKPQQVEDLTRWVTMGAPWPEGTTAATDKSTASKSVDPKAHWAFQPVKPHPIPAVKNQAWVKSPIDAFVLSRIEAKGLKPVEPADRRTLLRRVTFDLIGLPPTPQEVDAFLADDSPEAFARVVDRLLDNPHYGERWGRHWLDVARYGEDQAHTFEARLYPHGYKYRDWVVKALNNDMPYDQFVTAQIAGDLMEGMEEKDRLAALGFFALGPVYYGKAIADERDDRIDTLSRGFLALTVACARCHDHKFDPIPTTDYYSLAGIFASTEYREFPDAPREVVEAHKAKVKSKAAEADAFLPLSAVRGYFNIPKDQAEAFLPAESRKAYKALRAEADKLTKAKTPPYPIIHTLTDVTKPENLKVAIRGNMDNLGDEAPRRFLKILSEGEPKPYQKGSGRLELARSIVDPKNPLTARVMVNRVWEHHFGRGIVATPSNFGTLGEPPTHPQLLDWLAARFVSQGWSLKTLHREILLSATYQLSSRNDPANAEVDSDNTLLWRQNRRRLEVEAWRDAMLAVSGELDLKLGGPSQELTASSNRRRTFYASISRHNLDNLLRLFDYPDPNITCDRRVVTTVPLQQLFVLNSDFMVRQAKALAKKLTGDAGLSDAERVKQAYPLVFGRPASPDELAAALEFLGASSDDSEKARTEWTTHGRASGSAWEQYAQVLLGSNEFLYVD